jgi:CBS domain containing-hemolysin-like protein
VIAQTLAIAVLYVIWAFFAGSETAFVSANRFKLYNLRKRGRRSARLASFLLEKPERLLSTTLIGVNLALVLSSNLMARFFLDLYGEPKPLLSLLSITVLSLILCEVLPKNLALIRNLQWTLLSSFPLLIFYVLFYPVAKVFSFLTKVVVRLLGITQSGLFHGLFKKKEDVQYFISTHLESHYSKDESRYFQDSLDFGEKRLYEVMVPLVDVFALPDTARIRDCYGFIKEHHKNTIPVFRERIDNIVGVITVRELLLSDRNLRVSEVMKNPIFFPETKNVSELYREAYEQGYSTVFAVDEYGGITGLATMYDIGEEIIGRIETFEEVSSIVRVNKNEFLCNGDMEIDELERLLPIDLEHPDLTTLNGLFANELGKIPEEGDTLRLKGYVLTVVKGSRKKADLIRIHKVD